MFCTREPSCARADDAQIVRSRNAQCKTRESPEGGSLELLRNTLPVERELGKDCS